MQPKERILAALRREKIDRIPIDIWHTEEVAASLRAHTGTQTDLEMYKALKLDKIVWDFMDYRTAEGESAGSQVGAVASGARTMWGVPLRKIQSGAAQYDEFGEAPMKDITEPAQVADYVWWPDPDRFDYDGALERARVASKDFAVIGPWVSFFEIYCQVRGLELAMMDLALNPELVEAILDRIEAIQTEMMQRFLAQAAPYLDLVFISDDMAGQTSLLMSPRMWRRHIQPRMVRWCELVHSFGLKVFYHTDGAAEPLIAPLIECGIDVLNPIQHICPGMDPAELKRKYGDRVIFHGGVDNQHVLPFGTPDDVRQEVRNLMATLGAGREGFICSSCHNIQAGTKVENIIAMIETVQQS